MRLVAIVFVLSFATATATAFAWTHGTPGPNFLLDGSGGYLLDGIGGKLVAQ